MEPQSREKPLHAIASAAGATHPCMQRCSAGERDGHSLRSDLAGPLLEALQARPSGTAESESLSEGSARIETRKWGSRTSRGTVVRRGHLFFRSRAPGAVLCAGEGVGSPADAAAPATGAVVVPGAAVASAATERRPSRHATHA